MNSYGSFCGWLVVLAVVGFGVRTVHPQELANSLTAEQVLNNQYDLVFQATRKRSPGSSALIFQPHSLISRSPQPTTSPAASNCPGR